MIRIVESTGLRGVGVEIAVVNEYIEFEVEKVSEHENYLG